jgi:two-component system nitrogen regulation response regulator GlnG
MPGPSGLELLDRVRALGADVAVVIITAQNTFENAVEAMKRGALDYLVKPFGVAEVRALADKALRVRALQHEVAELRREVGRRALPGDRLVGKSPALLEVFKTVGRVAGSNVPVLVTGESGTGKELVARAIHAASPRSGAPFVALNTAAIPRELLESELFGHERGAFTGAVAARTGRFREADGGTLFLDEIGDMPIELQAKLLRVLQNGEVTPVGGSPVEEGSFREDLLYRLRVVPVHIPPLRQRTEDIPVLAEHFTSRYAEELGLGSRFLSDETVRRLEAYDWPGNVRELENSIKRALVLSAGDVLGPEDFSFLGGTRKAGDRESLADLVADEVESALEGGEGEVYRRILERVERPLLERVLARTDGNQIRAAALLGINRNTLRKKIVDLGIQIPGRD